MTETLLLAVAITVVSSTGRGVDCQQIREACVDRPWSSQPNDEISRVRIVDAILGSTVAFLCRYCGERDTGEARFWYASNRYLGGDTKEVVLGMADPVESNRVYMRSDRSLVVRNLTSSDVSRYSCSGLGSNSSGIEFALDLLPAAPELTVSANSMADWMRYESGYLTTVANKFPEQVRQIGSDWDTWGSCDGCAGKRYRRAACRVRFEDGTRMACRSTNKPATISTALAVMLSSIPDFLLAETCYAYCKQSSKSHNLPKYRNTFVLEEGSSLTLVCAEATAGGKVTWRKDGLLLTDSNTNDNDDVRSGAELDSFGTLYLVELSIGDSGNYTCYIDGNRIQEVLVAIRKSSVFESKAYVRHLYYLYYVLALYFVVFSARIFYAFLNRHNFVKITEEEVLRPEIPTPYLGKKIRIR